jgi:hypothetical protein
VRKKQGGLLVSRNSSVYLNGAELYTYAFLLSEAKLTLKMLLFTSWGDYKELFWFSDFSKRLTFVIAKTAGRL